MITNIAAYRFVRMTGLKPLRDRLILLCKAWRLKGTILLSTEGINLFVAGRNAEIGLLLDELRTVAGLEDLQPKFSESEGQPYTRMLVKIKKEIIAFGVEGIDPAQNPAPRLPARELKLWLDEGRTVILLDTRNDYEVKLGTFRNALSLNLDHFRHFPQAARQLPDELREQPVVTFCTGGIRCEKAAPYLQSIGFKNVFQLDGGILKYFQECHGAHYHGECFVFDQRVSVDPSLNETDTMQCFRCLAPLDAQEQLDPRFVPGRSCPFCFKTDQEQHALALTARHEALRRATTPLPGCEPYENDRPVHVPAAFDGLCVLDFLCGVFSHMSRLKWLEIFNRRFFLNAQKQPVDPKHIVRAGERYYHRHLEMSEPLVNVDIRIIHEDTAIIVLQKPAPLPMHPSGRFNRHTLQSFLSQVYYPQKPRPAHRLDANTTGVVVFTRTAHFARILQPQFEKGQVEKHYLVRVQGHPVESQFTCTEPISVQTEEVGLRSIDPAGGLAARTDFRVIQRLADGTTLLQATPWTGRTHQIRLHLWQRGWPVCGDEAYLPGQQRGATQTSPLTAPPLCLHAHRLTFTHPLTKQRVTFEANPPVWTEPDAILANQ